MLPARLYTIFTLVICLYIFPALCQHKEQVYIFIRPQVLLLSEDATEGTVEVVCRQLPRPPSVSGQQLLVKRKPLQRTTASAEETLAAITTNNPRSITGSFKSSAKGSVDKELVVTLPTANCLDSHFTYICRSVLTNRQNNTATATFRTAALPARLSLRAQPLKRFFIEGDTVILMCSSGQQVIGISGSFESEARWVWQYSDGGAWKAVSGKDVSGGLITLSGGCFQKSVSATSLKVRVESFKTYARRFRCYTQQGSDTSADNAQEFLVSMGFDSQSAQVLGTDPVVAIVVVLAVVAMVLILVYAIVQEFSRKRKKLKERRRKQIQMRILSPMTPEQRDRLLKEKLDKKAKEPPPPPPAPEPPKPLITLQDFPIPPETPQEGDDQEQEEEEEEEEDKGDVDKKPKKKKKKKKKGGVKVVVETTEDEGGSESGWVDSSATEGLSARGSSVSTVSPERFSVTD